MAQEQVRERQHHIEDAGHERVQAAADVAGDDPEEDPQHGRDQVGEDADLEGDARAEEDPREDVAAELVGAEEVRRRRRPQLVGELLVDRVVGRELSAQGPPTPRRPRR